MKITIERNKYAPAKERFIAYWGEPFSGADFWGTGSTVEGAVVDLINNYDIPDWHTSLSPDFTRGGE